MPKNPPKTWMYIVPPASVVLKMCSRMALFKAKSMHSIEAIPKSWKRLHFPRIAPKVINTAAAA